MGNFFVNLVLNFLTIPTKIYISFCDFFFMALIDDKKYNKIVNLIEYCERTSNPKILICELKTDVGKEEIIVGEQYAVLELAMKSSGACSYQPTYSGYALGFEDKEGNVWYGGADPSNFVNELETLGYISLDEKVLETAIHPFIDDIEKKYGDVYVWRPNYQARHISQLLSKVKLNEIKID